MENKLRLSVEPDIEKYKQRMDEIKNAIREILDTAMIDFLMVNSVFKKYNQFAEPSIAAPEAARISLSVKELQYMDIFSQKLNHVIALQETLVEKDSLEQSTNGQGNAPRDYANFIFKLNQLQAAVACFDFAITVTDLKKGLHELHNHIIEVTRLDFHESDYFKHLQQIEERLAGVVKTLREIAYERIAESPIDHGVKNQVLKINNLYTMANERYVLLWLLKHWHGQAEDLIEAYKLDGFVRVEEEIELF